MTLDGVKVLLVEDNIMIQMDLQMILEDEGASVVTASNLAEGMAIARGDYNAAILDIRLPDGEVFPVAEVLQKQNTPFIFHSGNIETSNLGSKFPDAITLSKPVSDMNLINAIRQVLPAA